MTYQTLNHKDSSFKAYSILTQDEIKSISFYNDFRRLLFGLKKFEVLDSFESTIVAKQSDDKIDTALRLMELKYNLLEINQLPDYLQYRYRENLNLSGKSALVAGIASALVPGLGKVYYGRTFEGVNMFMMNILMAGLATEAYFKHGPSNPMFIVFGSLSAVFYTGNIVGAVLGLKKLKKDYRNQMHDEIYNHYLADYSRYPY